MPRRDEVTEALRPDPRPDVLPVGRQPKAGREVCEGCGEYLERPTHKRASNARGRSAPVHGCKSCGWAFGRARAA